MANVTIGPRAVADCFVRDAISSSMIQNRNVLQNRRVAGSAGVWHHCDITVLVYRIAYVYLMCNQDNG